jgi:hypothetical protein
MCHDGLGEHAVVLGNSTTRHCIDVGIQDAQVTKCREPNLGGQMGAAGAGGLAPVGREVLPASRMSCFFILL